MKRTSLTPPSPTTSRPTTPTGSPARSSGSLDALNEVSENLRYSDSEEESSIDDILQYRQLMLEAGDLTGIRENLRRHPEVGVELDLSNGFSTERFELLMAAWPEQGEVGPELKLNGNPAVGVSPEVMARVFTDPHITRLQLDGVPMDPPVLQAIASGIERNGTRLHELTCLQATAQMFSPGLAQLLPLLPRLKALHLQLTPQPDNRVLNTSECGGLMLALLNKPLQELSIRNFGEALRHMIPHWAASALLPDWKLVRVEGVNLGLNVQNRGAEWSFRGFTGFVHFVICRSSATQLMLSNLGSDAQMRRHPDPPLNLNQPCFAEIRRMFQTSLQQRSRQPGAKPIYLSLGMTDMGVLRILLPAIASPTTNSLQGLDLSWVHPGYAPPDKGQMQAHARQFLQLVAQHIGQLKHTDQLSIHLDLPGSATHPGAEEGIHALSQALGGLHLTSLDFGGIWFDDVPDVLENRIHAAMSQAVHMQLQRQALGSCIRFGGPAYAQLGEVGGEVLGRLEHPDRLLPVLPALDSAHLKAFVDRYEARRAQLARTDHVALPGVHPLKAVSDSVQQRLKGGA